MNGTEFALKICSEVEQVLANTNPNEILGLCQELKNAKRIFVTGEGRSGLMGKAFAMRLMHSGFTVYVVGETITPNIEFGDLLVAISGSGETQGTSEMAIKARGAGARVAVVTTNINSKLANAADHILLLPAATKYRMNGEMETIQPLGSLFDQSVHLVMDTAILCLIELTSGSKDEFGKRHANLE